MNVIVDLTVRDEDGHILLDSKNKLLQTNSEPISAEYTREELDLRVAMCLPTIQTCILEDMRNDNRS